MSKPVRSGGRDRDDRGRGRDDRGRQRDRSRNRCVQYFSIVELHCDIGLGQDLGDAGGLQATGQSQGRGRREGTGGEREINLNRII